MGKERDYIVHDDSQIKGFFGEYRYLSNYHVADVFYDGLMYPSSEHAFQAAKSLDNGVRQSFRLLKCAEAKRLGQEVELRKDWGRVKLQVMYEILLDKFTRYEDLKEALLATGEKYLEETNHWNDKFWGVCDGEGSNFLGYLLMTIRSKIALESEV